MATILCVNDNLRVLETQNALLQQKGYKVLTAFDGTTAIEITRNQLELGTSPA